MMMKYSFPNWTLGLFLLLTAVFGCNKEYDTIDVVDDRNIHAYIEQNNLSAMQPYNSTGIYYQVLNSGTGPVMLYSDKIPLIYTARSLDGRYVSVDTFSANNRYASFLGYFKPDSLAIVVGEKLQKRNGVIRILLPSRYAYGKNGFNGIPSNASLDYTITTLDETKQPQYDDFSIRKYLVANNLTGFIGRTASGIYYKIINPGSGVSATLTSTVTLEYTGQLFNGTVFSQALPGAGISFRLNTTIPGWQEVLQLVQQGGSVRMILPSASGYGFPDPLRPNVYAPFAAVPAFSCLDFTVNVVGVTN
ncbi:MAG: hypothetical protein E6Q66_05725 [Pedobacter sp.]|nr:MAG: hypothetical protein E6Q66_05725 [Pedobacter sp.]